MVNNDRVEKYLTDIIAELTDIDTVLAQSDEDILGSPFLKILASFLT